MHPLLKAAEAKLKAPPVAKAVAKKPSAASPATTVPKVGSEHVGGWEVQTVSRKKGRMYKLWWSPQGKMFQTKGAAMAAGFALQ